MSNLDEKIKVSIERLKAFEPEEGYYLADSGGKDSTVCHALCEMAGVKHDDHYRLTSVDPPELVQFLMRERPNTEIEKPRYEDGSQITMWNLIVKMEYPPIRTVRYCCKHLKEDGGDGRKTVTGVRWEESARRKNNQGLVTIMNKTKDLEDNANFMSTKVGGVVLVNDNADSRRMVEQCYKRSKTTINPIIDWTYRDVWDFIHAYGIHYCELYDEGWERLGCVGCPMARTHGRDKQFNRWPTYKKAYINAFQKMVDAREKHGKKNNWGTGLDVFNWWMEYEVQLEGQADMFSII